MDDSQTLTSHQTKHLDASHSLSSLRSDKKKSKYKPLKKDNKPLGDKFSSIYATAVIEQKDEGDAISPSPRHTEPDEPRIAPANADSPKANGQTATISQPQELEHTKLGEHNYESIGFPEQKPPIHDASRLDQTLGMQHPSTVPLLPPQPLKRPRVYKPISTKNTQTYLEKMNLVKYDTPGQESGSRTGGSSSQPKRTYKTIRGEGDRYFDRLSQGRGFSLEGAQDASPKGKSGSRTPQGGVTSPPTGMVLVDKKTSGKVTPSGRGSKAASAVDVKLGSAASSKKSFVVKTSSDKASKSKASLSGKQSGSNHDGLENNVDYNNIYKKYNMLYAQIEIEEMQKLGYLREYLQPQFWDNGEEQAPKDKVNSVHEDSQELVESTYINSAKFKVMRKEAKPEALSHKTKSVHSQENFASDYGKLEGSNPEFQPDYDQDRYGPSSSRSLMDASGPIKRPPAASHFPVLDNKSFFEKCKWLCNSRQVHQREQTSES